MPSMVLGTGNVEISKKKDLRSQFRGGGNLLNKGGKTRRVLGAVADVHTHTHTHTHIHGYPNHQYRYLPTLTAAH